MKLTSLAFLNIRRNLRNYAMYFFAMCFCVFTTYTFAVLALSESVSEKLISSVNYQNMFIGFGIAILVFVFFFLLSSNKSFIKYRKKEISTYALFGMPNGRIGRLLFFETLIIGTAALIAGILFGIFFSKLLTMILLKMVMSSLGGDIRFAIEPIALLITVIIYLGIFSVMGLSGLRVINKFSLVDLFKAKKVSEGSGKGSYVMLAVSIILILLGYAVSLLQNAGIIVIAMIFVIAVVVLGTYLFFAGGLQKLFYLIKKNKKRLYKKSRLVSVSLLSHKSKTMAATMGTIAVLVAVSTTAIAFGYTIYHGTEKSVHEISSFDVWYSSDDTAITGDVQAVLDEHGLKVHSELSLKMYETQPAAKNMPDAYSSFFGQDSLVTAYSESDYNAIVSVSKDSNVPLNVAKGKVVVLYPNYNVDINADDVTILFDTSEFDAQFQKVRNSYSFGGNLLTLVLGDTDFDELLAQGQIFPCIGESGQVYFAGINYDNALKEGDAAARIAKVFSTLTGSYRIAYDFYTEQMSMFGLICFIGYFICAVFILMSVSMLYFKQVVIGTEEKRQYEILRNIGMSIEEEKRAVRNRLAPVFFLPLFVGIVHSLFAMKAADTIIFSNILVSTGSTYTSVLLASLAMYLVYIVIYSAFYIITRSQYAKVIS